MGMILDHISYCYSPGTAYETKALSDVSLNIDDGEFIGLIGKSGSGKSTLIQHMNGLLKASSGTIYYQGNDIYDKTYDLKELRTQVGMVFQYPEHQLFETTVFEDVKFGPKNQGLSDKEATLRAYEALELVGFPEELFSQSPFDLSGGQKRRAAIAGVLSMKPLMLILDEPTAGLDPRGRTEILELIKTLHGKSKRTILLVSHNMEDVANYVHRLLVMDNGKICYDDTPRNVYANIESLENIGLRAPEVTYLMRDLHAIGMKVDKQATTVDEAVTSILSLLS